MLFIKLLLKLKLLFLRVTLLTLLVSLKFKVSCNLAISFFNYGSLTSAISAILILFSFKAFLFFKGLPNISKGIPGIITT